MDESTGGESSLQRERQSWRKCTPRHYLQYNELKKSVWSISTQGFTTFGKQSALNFHQKGLGICENTLQSFSMYETMAMFNGGGENIQTAEHAKSCQYRRQIMKVIKTMPSMEQKEILKGLSEERMST